MKRIRLHLLLVTLVALVITSCEKEDLSFDETLLIGTWVSGTEFYKYKAGGNGATWDESEDVKEEEALHFTWTLVKSDLTHIHIMEDGNKVPKSYTVTELSATTLKYKDDFGGSYVFKKVR